MSELIFHHYDDSPFSEKIRLVASDVHDVALRREAPEVGEVVVHFPRAGFRVAVV